MGFRLVGDYGRHFSGDMNKFLGLAPKKKLPVEGMPAREVQGVMIYVLSLAEAKERGLFHRVRAVCPKCGVHMSAGRTHQHKCGA
jgi:tRNA(Ile2) C34 agmatinyltransferase TiaS